MAKICIPPDNQLQYCSPQCNLIILCDNIAIVTTTQRNTSSDQEQQEFIGPPTRPDYDMLLEILKAQLALAKILPQLSETQHIKGHQDRAIPFAELTRPAQLNVLADDLATNHPTDLLAQETQQPMPLLSSCQAYLLKNNELITSKEFFTARWSYNNTLLEQYWEE